MLELDNSQLALFLLCPRKYQYIYREHLENKVGNAAHFSTHLIHKPICAWHQGLPPDWDVYFEAYKAVAIETLAPKKGDDLYTLARARDIYNKYTETFKSDLSEFDFVTSEVAVSFPIACGDRWITKPDLVLRERATGRLGVLDLKASKWGIGAELIPFDRQFLGQAKHVGADWMMKGHIQLLKSENRLTRSRVKVSPDLLAEWEAELDVVYRFVELCEKSGIWPKNSPGGCSAFNQKCEFLEVCGAGELRKVLIEEWPKGDPFAYLKGA